MLIHEAVDKRFLNNKANEGGSVCWDVKLHQGRKTGRTNIDSKLDIRDCYHKISLEFFVDTPIQFKERLAKLEELIDSLSNFHKALVDARYKSIDSMLKFRREKKGERFSSKETKEVCKD